MESKEKDVCRNLKKIMTDSEGVGSAGIACKRLGAKEDYHVCNIGDFLRRPENQSGMWLIDAGNGTPPGAFTLVWGKDEYWKFIGFYNHHLIVEDRKCPDCEGKGGKDDGSGEVCTTCLGKGSTSQ